MMHYRRRPGLGGRFCAVSATSAILIAVRKHFSAGSAICHN